MSPCTNLLGNKLYNFSRGSNPHFGTHAFLSNNTHLGRGNHPLVSCPCPFPLRQVAATVCQSQARDRLGTSPSRSKEYAVLKGLKRCPEPCFGTFLGTSPQKKKKNKRALPCGFPLKAAPKRGTLNSVAIKCLFSHYLVV